MISLLRIRRARLWMVVLLSAAVLWACRAKEKTEVEVEVRSVGFDNVSNAPVVVLQDHDRKMGLPIWIGPAEAQSIAMQMQGVNPPRPLTHDLMKTILERAGVEFQKVVIQDLKESTYYARIYLQAGRQELEVDSRPSDAIALAVRFHKPIFVATALMKGDTAIDLQREAGAATTVKFSGVTVQNLTDELAEYFSLPPGKGVIVADVERDAPEGLKRGDIVLEIDGDAVTGVGDFASKMQAVKSGQPAILSVQRGSERIPVQFVVRPG
jgi:bifunctional DNase/RNase